MKAVVTGAGGFIGGYLAAELAHQGHDVRAVDIKPLGEWAQIHDECENVDSCDLMRLENCERVVDGTNQVFNLASAMGGMNFIENHKLTCMLNVLINTHMLMAANANGTERFFYSGSACCYAAEHQTSTENVALKESDAYPAQPEDGYGWEKLFSERMCQHFDAETNMTVRSARFHNVYGPNTAFDDLRGKAPASLSRKVAEAIVTGSHKVEIWGDGLQVRSFMWVDDCVDGILKITALDNGWRGPMNLGSAELVSINELVSIIESIAGVTSKRVYKLDAPQGVRGRSSDNTLCREVLDGWEPSTSLRDGIARLYSWVEGRVIERLEHG